MQWKWTWPQSLSSPRTSSPLAVDALDVSGPPQVHRWVTLFGGEDCFTIALRRLNTDCRTLSTDERQRLAFASTNCFFKDLGRQPFRCTSTMSIAQCAKDLPADVVQVYSQHFVAIASLCLELQSRDEARYAQATLGVLTREVGQLGLNVLDTNEALLRSAQHTSAHLDEIKQSSAAALGALHDQFDAVRLRDEQHDARVAEDRAQTEREHNQHAARVAEDRAQTEREHQQHAEHMAAARGEAERAEKLHAAQVAASRDEAQAARKIMAEHSDTIIRAQQQMQSNLRFVMGKFFTWEDVQFYATSLVVSFLSVTCAGSYVPLVMLTCDMLTERLLTQGLQHELTASVEGSVLSVVVMARGGWWGTLGCRPWHTDLRTVMCLVRCTFTAATVVVLAVRATLALVRRRRQEEAARVMSVRERQWRAGVLRQLRQLQTVLAGNQCERSPPLVGRARLLQVLRPTASAPAAHAVEDGQGQGQGQSLAVVQEEEEEVQSQSRSQADSEVERDHQGSVRGVRRSARIAAAPQGDSGGISGGRSVRRRL